MLTFAIRNYTVHQDVMDAYISALCRGNADELDKWYYNHWVDAVNGDEKAIIALNVQFPLLSISRV
jgi:hypothetical protein